jgi:hemerythrin
MADEPGCPDGGFDEMDREHHVQLELLASLRTAVRKNQPSTDIAELLGRLLDYSSAHFLSEKLLMRLHAYPEYEAHVQENDQVTQRMETLRDSIVGGRADDAVDTIDALHDEMLGHIRRRDTDLGRFLAEQAAPTDSGRK